MASRPRPARSTFGAVVAVATLSAVAPPAVAAERERAPIEARCHDVAVKDDLAVLAQTGGIVTLDVGDPQRMRELGRMGLKATVVGVTLDGQRAWLAAGSHGVVLVDLTDPSAPRLVQRIDVVGRVRQVVASGARLLVAENRHGLSVIDVSDPSRARRTASVGTRDELKAIALRDGLLATAEDLAGIRLFDVTRPDTPRELAQLDLEGARDLAFVEERLVVAAGRRGLVVLDLSDPRSPKLIGELAPARSALTVAAHGRLALVGNGSAGVQIVDPLAEGAPREIHVFGLSRRYPAGRMASAADRVFVAADLGGLVVLDLTEVGAPRLIHPPSRRMRVRMP